MIETPQSSIKPEQELARLTLETESVKEKMRRRSTLKTDRPSLGDMGSFPTMGPLTMAEYARIGGVDNEMLESPTDATDMHAVEEGDKDDVDHGERATEDTPMDDGSSEATLVSQPDIDQAVTDGTTVEEQQSILDDKENLSPDKPAPAPSPKATPAQTTDPLTPTSPSKLNAQAGALSLASPPVENGPGQELVKYQPPPGPPPPVPPRKPNQSATTTLEEYARQQDVTEVMNHCIIQLSCAMRPTGYDKSGEQHDEVHDLFFGQQIVHTQPETVPPQPVPFLNIITRVYHEPTDVYAAIDNEYDLQDAQDGTQAYTSVARLPPVLSIALDRVSWNQQARRQEKLNHHVEVLETVYMDRYLEGAGDSELTRRRRQTWEMKQELAMLAARRSVLEEKHVSPGDRRRPSPPLNRHRVNPKTSRVSWRMPSTPWNTCPRCPVTRSRGISTSTPTPLLRLESWPRPPGQNSTV